MSIETKLMLCDLQQNYYASDKLATRRITFQTVGHPNCLSLEVFSTIWILRQSSNRTPLAYISEYYIYYNLQSTCRKFAFKLFEKTILSKIWVRIGFILRFESIEFHHLSLLLPLYLFLSTISIFAYEAISSNYIS